MASHRHHQQLQQPSLNSPYQGSGFAGHQNADYLAAWNCRNLVMLNHMFRPVQLLTLIVSTRAFWHSSGRGRTNMQVDPSIREGILKQDAAKACLLEGEEVPCCKGNEWCTSTTVYAEKYMIENAC
ncbi:hypothetical protein C5167_045222 [Papaver somniferum]|uniref:Uncharacterized protein n=1 Tax=Papaver somniferum TaxID=3469 RepID=A0A4Y7LCL5_PAPSO|nr:hypothetical protein C5167_045222 [Papaver somniferum]